MDSDDARRRFGAARVARLATVRPDGAPHLVPLVFALDITAQGEALLYSAVDAKPKRSTALRRLANIAGQPRVSLLADYYTEDWTRLWWVRADGIAQLLPVGGEQQVRALRLLAERYPSYRRTPPPGPALVVRVTRWTGWAASD